MSTLMVQGTSSNAGKTTLVVAMCRLFHKMGYSVAPFKSQNMSRFTFRGDGFLISQAQALQAAAARIKPSSDMNPIVLAPNNDNSSTVYIDGKRRSMMSAKQYYRFAPKTGFEHAKAALKRLCKSYDLVIRRCRIASKINLQMHHHGQYQLQATWGIMFAIRMFAISYFCKFISAGDPAPSIITRSYDLQSRFSAAFACSNPVFGANR